MHVNFILKRGRWAVMVIMLFITAVIFLGACEQTDSVKDPKPLIPHKSWDCGMPNGIPSPESGELVLEIDMNLGDIYDVGQTQFGRRHIINIAGGTVSGPAIAGEIVDGGLDYQLTLSNGAMEIDQINVIHTNDNHYIYFRDCGAAADASDVRIVPDFEAPSASPYSFLNSGKYAGSRELDMDRKTMTLKIYDVAKVSASPVTPGAVRVTQPDDTPDQSWECRQADASEVKGDELYTETVTLAKTITVGRSKYGNRKIMNITGGSATGRIAGEVLPGGADYQLFKATSINIDARYNILTNDNEVIIVRNCGRAARAIPTFEAPVDGNYSYLNDQLWLSSFPAPKLDLTEVSVTIFESSSNR